MEFYYLWQNAATDPWPLTLWFIWNYGALPLLVLISAIGMLLDTGR